MPRQTPRVPAKCRKSATGASTGADRRGCLQGVIRPQQARQLAQIAAGARRVSQIRNRRVSWRRSPRVPAGCHKSATGASAGADRRGCPQGVASPQQARQLAQIAAGARRVSQVRSRRVSWRRSPQVPGRCRKSATGASAGADRRGCPQGVASKQQARQLAQIAADAAGCRKSATGPSAGADCRGRPQGVAGSQQLRQCAEVATGTAVRGAAPKASGCRGEPRDWTIRMACLRSCCSKCPCGAMLSCKGSQGAPVLYAGP